MSYPLSVQVKEEVTVNNEIPIVSSVRVTRLKGWKRALLDTSAPALTIVAAFDAYLWLGGDGESNFNAWQENEAPLEDWQKLSTYISRTNNGLPIEVQDIMGRYASTLYDEKTQYAIATFSNARLLNDEADYLGFEEYEEGKGWTLQPANKNWKEFIEPSTSYTGKYSLKLSQVSTGENYFSKTFVPEDQNSQYIFSYWYKTEKEFSPINEDAGWFIILEQDGAEIHKIFLSFESTNNKWIYVSHSIDLKPFASQEKIQIHIKSHNKLSAAVFIDNIRFSSFLGEFSAKVYDSYNGLTTASLGPNMQVGRTIYDSLLQPIAIIGPDENVNSISLEYYARQIGKEISQDNPNALISVTGNREGFYNDFHRDGDYNLHWKTQESMQWSIEGEALFHSYNTLGTITLNTPQIDERYAVYLSAVPRNSLQNPLGIKIGQDTTLQWEPSIKKWKLQVGTTTWYSDVQTAGMQKEWFIYVYDSAFLFFADGQKIFAEVASQNIQGEFSIFAADLVEFTKILICSDPQISISYTDGATNERQSQALIGATSLITATVYDYLGRAAITTKPAKLSPNSDHPLLSYRKTFITSIDWDTGVMEGEISDYYSPGGGGFSNDEGYPYSRSIFENSPQGNIIEVGLPGKDFAIVDLHETKPEERHTIKYRYFTNQQSDGFMLWLPEGQYKGTKTIDSDGNESISLSDQSGNIVGQGQLIDKETKKYQLTVNTLNYLTTGKETITYLPNYYDPSQINDKDKWKMQAQVDMLGRVISAKGPNSGLVESVYDLSGAIRFSQDAEGRAQGYYFYTKYDEVGRPIESGIIEGTWDKQQLEDYAKHSPEWPKDCLTWSAKQTYDGDGSNPFLMSRLIKTQTHGSDFQTLEAANEETLTYDLEGNVKTHTLTILKSKQSYTTTYSYDSRGRVIDVSYPTTPQNTSPLKLSYTYNQLNQVISIQDSLKNLEYASYTYNADGSILSESLASNQASAITRTYSYISPGWVQELTDKYFAQKIYYTLDSQGQPGYYSGLIAEEEFSYLGSIPAGVTPLYSYRYTYDTLNQLLTAENIVKDQTQTQWSIGLNGSPLTYDNNGNILTYQDGDTFKDYRYELGKDEVKNTTGTTEQDYTYNLNGNLSASSPKEISNITYNQATGKEDAIIKELDTIIFEYNSSNQRILKTSTALEKIYLHGLSTTPLIEETSQNNLSQESVIYLYGLRGLIGFIKNSELHLILSDRVGSNRVLLDSEGTAIGAYTYLPFGNFMDDPKELKDLTAYFFTGQEFDQDINLYNFKARFYDPDLGRFYSTDAAGQFASPYIYGANNPIMFIDPSGNFSFGAFFTGLTAGLAIIAGALLTIATAGAAAPAAIGMGVLASTLIGGGSSSLLYSVTHRGDNWNVKDWASETGIGIGTGLVTGGTSMVAGAAVSSAVKALTTTVKSAAIKAGTGIMVNGIADAGLDVGLTFAFNKARKQEAGTSDILTSIGLGFLGGFSSSLAGFKSGFRAGIAKNYRFDRASIQRIQAIPTKTNATPMQGVTGIYNTRTGMLDAEDFSAAAEGSKYGPQHLQMAKARYGSVPNRRAVVDGATNRNYADYPDLRGFSVTRPTSGEAVFGFSSYSLNQNRPSAIAARFMSQEDTIGTLIAARIQLGRNINLHGNAVFNFARGLTTQLKSPYSYIF
jgi:RHS repeat-associated protein